MICAVSLNPAVDKYLRLPQLRVGEHQEIVDVVTSAGGKAINVAGVVRALGEPVMVLGFFGGYTGRYLLDEIEREGIEPDAVLVEAHTRTAFVLVEDSGAETEVVEPGAAVTEDDIAQLRAKLRERSKTASVVVLSGSVPPGCPTDIYVRLIQDCHGHCPVLLDTSKHWLRAAVVEEIPPSPNGLQARFSKPAMIKPNRREAEQLLGRKLTKAADFRSAVQELYDHGIGLPMISDGEQGLYSRGAHGILRARPPKVERVNSVGSGDATVAGFAVALARELPYEDSLRLAVACGTANVLTKECAKVNAEDVERLLPGVELEELK